jgi:transposase
MTNHSDADDLNVSTIRLSGGQSQRVGGFLFPILSCEAKDMSDKVNYAAFIGIDWADRQHAVCLWGMDKQRLECQKLDQSPEAIDKWAQGLGRRFYGKPVAVIIEQSRGPLVYALMKYAHIVLFLINPKQLARYREAVSPSGAKNDPGDARLLCEFLYKHHLRLRPWKPDDAVTRSIRLLAEDRRKCVGERTKLTNQLHQALKECFPQALELVGAALHVAAFLKLLAKYPTLKEMQRASPKTFQRMLPRRRQKADLADAAQAAVDPSLAAIRQAIPLVADEALLMASRMTIKRLVVQIAALNRAIAEYDRELERLMQQHPDAKLFESLPGAGRALAPRLLAAMGADRDQFAAAAEVQQASGIAPVTAQSGKTQIVRRRRACPRFLKQTFQEFAEHSLRRSPWAQAYYKMLRQKRNAGHQAAVRSLAFKWIRIIYRCWKNRCPYNEQRYQHSLRKTNSPLLAYLASDG